MRTEHLFKNRDLRVMPLSIEEQIRLRDAYDAEHEENEMLRDYTAIYEVWFEELLYLFKTGGIAPLRARWLGGFRFFYRILGKNLSMKIERMYLDFQGELDDLSKRHGIPDSSRRRLKI